LGDILNVKHDAAKVLGNVGKTKQKDDEAAFKSIVQALEVALDDDNFWNVVRESLKCLGQIGVDAVERWESLQPPPKSPQELFDSLHDDSEDVRNEAAKTLVYRSREDSDAQQMLAKALKNQDIKVRHAIADILEDRFYNAFETYPRVKAENSMVQALIATLGNDDTKMRLAATKCLGLLQNEDDNVMQALASTLRDKDESVRIAATHSLGERKQADKYTLQALITVLRNDHSENARYAAANSLGMLKQQDDTVIESLKIVIHKEISARVCVAAANSLGQLGQNDDDDVLQTLINAVSDNKESVRNAAASSLGKLGQENSDVLNTLITAAKDDNLVTTIILFYLGELGEGNDNALQVLLTRLHHDEKMICIYAASGLAKWKYQTLNSSQQYLILAGLQTLLDHNDPYVIQKAVEFLHSFLDGEQLPSYRWKLLSQKGLWKKSLFSILKRIGGVLFAALMMLGTIAAIFPDVSIVLSEVVKQLLGW